MGAASITLPQRLSEKLREKAEETGYLPEELGVELLRKSLDEELDPEDLVEHYETLSEKYLSEADGYLGKGNLVQSSEKLWGAAASSVKALAAKRGLKLERHGSLWDFIDKLAEERGDEEILTFFHTANSLHRNFYENQMTRRAVEVAGKEVKRLIEKLKEGSDKE
ncbi:MAG: PaREP1 family protein [Candidatus Methanospirareceae archaeon]